MAFTEGADGCENELFSKYPIYAEVRIRKCVFCVSQALIKQQPLYLLLISNSHCWIKNEMKNKKENVKDISICLVHHQISLSIRFRNVVSFSSKFLTSFQISTHDGMIVREKISNCF